jgi:hypothetical protein
LITLGTLFNCISQSEFDDGVAPSVTSAAYQIGQRCRKERIFDCYRKREVDIARELRSRNRNRNAGRRAEELARGVGRVWMPSGNIVQLDFLKSVNAA